MTVKINAVSSLPFELILSIFSLLDVQSLLCIGQVCTSWHEMAKDQQLWKMHCVLRWKHKQFKPSIKLLSVQNSKDVDQSVCWKMAYSAQETDSKRTTITRKELCSINWSFKFLDETIEIDQDEHLFSKFHLDGTYESSLFDRSLRYRIIEEEYVQVEMFPALVGRRTENWGWMLINDHVYLYSGQTDPFQIVI